MQITNRDREILKAVLAVVDPSVVEKINYLHEYDADDSHSAIIVSGEIMGEITNNEIAELQQKMEHESV